MSRGEPLILLLKVLQQLQACHSASLGATLEELAESCDVSTRTIRRKLKALQEAGIPIMESHDEERRKRYNVDPQKMPASHVSFEPFEAAALFVADGMMEAMEGLPLAKEARAALEKITESVPSSFQRELNGYIGALHGSLLARHEYAPFGQRFADLIDAISERWVIEIDYRSLRSSERAKTHVIHPYLIHCQTGTVYVVARRPQGDRFVTFTLDRIDAVRVIDFNPFDRDPQFDATAFVEESFNGFHEGEIVSVRVRFEAPVAKVIRERTWHASQRVEEAEDGSLVLTFQTAGPQGVLHWSKAFLPYTSILEPDWLAQRQREEAESWLARLKKTEHI